MVHQIISEKYLEMMKELLDSVHKSEAMLKKMVKKTQANQSDMDKINLQLFLDVEEFGNQLEKFGIDKSSFVPYNHLLNIVATGRKLKEDLSS